MHTEPDAAEDLRRANRTIARLALPLGLSSFGEFALESVSYIWVVSTFGAGSPTASLFIGALIVASTLPRLLVSPYAGVFADVRGARAALVVADAGRCAVMAVFVATLLVTDPQGRGPVAALVLFTLIVSAASQLLQPARAVAVRAGIAPAGRPRAASIALAIMTVSSLAAGGLAPLIFTVWGMVPTVVIIATTFLLGAISSQVLIGDDIGAPERADAARRQSVHRDIWVAVRAAARIPVLRLLMVGVAVYGLALGVTNSVLPLFLMGSLGLSPQEYGFVSASFAVGSFVGILVAPPLVRRSSTVAVYMTALICLGVGYIAFAMADGVFVAIGLMSVCGASFAAFSVTQGPIIQNASPRGMTGRVTSVMSPILALMAIAGALIANGALQLTTVLMVSPYVTYRAMIATAGVVVIAGGLVIYTRRRGASDSEASTKGPR